MLHRLANQLCCVPSQACQQTLLFFFNRLSPNSAVAASALLCCIASTTSHPALLYSFTSLSPFFAVLIHGIASSACHPTLSVASPASQTALLYKFFSCSRFFSVFPSEFSPYTLLCSFICLSPHSALFLHLFVTLLCCIPSKVCLPTVLYCIPSPACHPTLLCSFTNFSIY